MTQTTAPSKLFRNGSKELLRVCRQIPYASSEELYANPAAYQYFIGEEIDGNAQLAKDALLQLQANGRSLNKLVCVETAAGTGSSVRDLHQVALDVHAIAVEIAEELCAEGRKVNPHIEFRAEDMIKFESFADESVDFIFNSASSLGFLTIEQLAEHIKNAGRILNQQGSYFADVGFYSCPQASYLDWGYVFKSQRDNGELVREPSMTLRYYPLSDTHDICYSTWVKQPDDADYRHVGGYYHNLRAYRFSEMRFLAKLAGLEARLWTYNDPKPGEPFVLSEVTDEFYFDESDMCSALVVEIHRPGAVRLA